MIRTNDPKASSSTLSEMVVNQGIRSVNLKPIVQDDRDYLRIAILTWNMNSKHSAVEDLKSLATMYAEHELIVIGLQNAPENKNISQKMQHYLLNSHRLICQEIMASLRLYVFALKTSKEFTKEIPIDSYRITSRSDTLSSDRIRNKRKVRVVAIRITYKDIVMNFICCQLTVHEDRLNARNSEIRKISESIFSCKDNPSGSSSQPHHLTVWLGGLNYRIAVRKIYNILENQPPDKFQLLLKHDQLIQEAEKGNVFKGYQEGLIRFNPTYKYAIGTSKYDTSAKKKKPAWTDRILYKIEDPNQIRADLAFYDSIDRITSSHHKPVRALLRLNLKNNEESQCRE